MIYCVGNSHANFFGGAHPGHKKNWWYYRELFASYALGPVTAYHFFEKYLLPAISAIKDCSKTYCEIKDSTMLVVGEIDCRFHIPYQAKEQNISYTKSIDKVLERYIPSFLLMQDKYRYNMIAWGVHAATHLIQEPPNPRSATPICGTMQERNKIILEWNDRLFDACEKIGVQTASITDHIVNEQFETDMSYFHDDIHLETEPLIDEVIKRMGL